MGEDAYTERTVTDSSRHERSVFVRISTMAHVREI